MNNVLSLGSVISVKSTSFFPVFKVLASILVVFLFIAHIFQINFEISEKYLVREQEKRVAELLTETRGLETTFAQKASLRAITPTLSEMDFQQADQVSYIEVSSQQVVIR